MTEQEALAAVKSILTPDALSSVQEIVLRFSLEGKLYPQIAREAGYHPEYLRDVGAQLWRSLSDALGQKVTKKNLRFVLANLDIQPQTLQPQTSQFPQPHPLQLQTLQPCLQKLPTPQMQTPQTERNVFFSEQNEQRADAQMAAFSFPSVAIPLQSAFYIPRSVIETQAYAEIASPGGVLRIKAPGNRGKTSLILRVLDHARTAGMQTVLLNFQEADEAILRDVGRFLRWFSSNVAYQLNLPPNLDQHWDPDIGNKVSCKIYFREYILKQITGPLVLALDEVDQIFAYPELVQEFFPMLRVWHEEAMEQSIWQNLRLLLSYNTEVYVPLKLSQSPFNIGLAVELPLLTVTEIQALAVTYRLDWAGEAGLLFGQQLYELVGGHPYLVQLALYWLSQSPLSLPDLLANAPTQSGIYRGHLRRHWQVLQRQPALLTALRQVIKCPQGSQLEVITAYRLESMGLIQLVGNVSMISCELYRRYFDPLLAALA